MECIQCHKNFETENKLRKLCSFECYRDRQKILSRERYLRFPLERKSCVTCGETFIPRSKAQICCKKLICRMERYGHVQQKMPIEEQKKQCVICGRRFISTTRITCTRQACVEQRRKNLAEARKVEKLEEKQPVESETLTHNPFPYSRSLFKQHIEEFLQRGGVVRRQRLGPVQDLVKQDEFEMFEFEYAI